MLMLTANCMVLGSGFIYKIKMAKCNSLVLIAIIIIAAEEEIQALREKNVEGSSSQNLLPFRRISHLPSDVTSDVLCKALQCPCNKDCDCDPPEYDGDDGCDCDYQRRRKVFLPLTKVGSKYYYIETFFKLNWFKAFKYCASHGLRLLTIESQAENTAIKKQLNDLGFGLRFRSDNWNGFWTAGTDQGDEGEFEWMTTGKRPNFRDWGPGEPNNGAGKEHCLEIIDLGYGLAWNDRTCDTPTRFYLRIS